MSHSRGKTGEIGTNRRKKAYSKLADIGDLPPPVSARLRDSVRELRKTTEGREVLWKTGRDSAEISRRPGATTSRRFVAWDGEGITYQKGTPQSYVLFGNSSGLSVQARELSTSQCLALMIETELEDPNVFHVGFAFNYDANMILRDVPRERLKRLRKEGSIRWNGYRIEYRPSKWFQVSREVGNGEGKQRVTCRIWDIWGFFQSSFVKALRAYLGERAEFDAIEAGKAHRGDFTEDEIETMIKPYWESELHYLVLLTDRLRSYLYSANLHITQWHGPGAIASYALRNHHMDQFMATCPEAVNDAAQYAYAGGRFELFKLGRHLGEVFQYDINSAYPDGISHLPSLAHGEWVHVGEFDPRYRFAIYKVRMRAPLMKATVPYPLFLRDEKHCIHFPPQVESWYWAPEIANIHKWQHVEILEGWVFQDDGTRPFDWVRDVYATRKEWKDKAHYNPAEKALKLLLNSLYGKMAQRVGWDKEKGTAPKWHQLEWAGWVTSYTRAKLYRAMLLAGDDLIGTETDAVYSSKPLDLSVSPELGDWDYAKYDEMIYLQSGFRFSRAGEEWTSKYRGFDKGSIHLDDIRTYLQNVDLTSTDHSSGFTGETTRFIGMGLAFVSKDPGKWRTWETTSRVLSLGRDGKRIHIPPYCTACKAGKTPYDGFHNLSVAKPAGGKSYPHNLPWKDGMNPIQNDWDDRKFLEDGDQ